MLLPLIMSCTKMQVQLSSTDPAANVLKYQC